jgi:hypothetical protein
MPANGRTLIGLQPAFETTFTYDGGGAAPDKWSSLQLRALRRSADGSVYRVADAVFGVKPSSLLACPYDATLLSRTGLMATLNAQSTTFKEVNTY